MGLYPAKFGKYILLERVNVGGMAEVFKAKAFGVAGFERIIALKRILPSLVEDEEFIKMFIDEARIAVQLDHPNIVQIYELGKHGDHYYIAMEYLASRDMRAVLDKLRASGTLMPIPQAAWIIAKVCEGLNYAHRRKDPSGEPMNIIHRDVSPQNILVTFDGDVKVIDFGIAKAANRASKTQAGVLKGKFGYMSPEQVRGLPIDRRSDIFAVGVLLYEMLTGERLFIGESDFSTLERVRNAEVIPPTTFNKNITPELERVVLKALAREPEDRYQWGSDLAEDLQQFVVQDNVPFGRNKLAGFMGKLYTKEIAKENASTEAFLRLQLGDVVGGRPSYDDDEDDATNVNAPIPSGTDEDASMPQPEEPDYEEFDGEDKTFVLEASEAGMALQPARGPVTEPPSPQPDFLGEPSLYGDDDEDLFDDSATQVSADNPFHEEQQQNTDEGGVSANDETYVPGMMDEDKTYVPVGGGPSTPGAISDETRQEGPPPMLDDPVAAAIQQDLASASMAGVSYEDEIVPGIQPPMSLPPPGQPPPSASGPAYPAGPRPPAPNHLYEETADAGVRAPPPPPAGISKGLLFSLVGGAVFSFLLLVGVAVFAFIRLGDAGGPANLILNSKDPAPPGVAVYVDDQPVAEGLPAAFPVTPGVAHKVRISAPGYKTIEMPFELPAGAQMPLQISLVKEVTAAAEPAEAPEDPKAPTEAAEPVEPEPEEAPDEAPAETPPAEAAAASGDPARPVAIDTWRVSLTAVSGGRSVHGAGVYLDGKLLGVTPFEHEFPKTQPQLALEFRAKGFATKQVNVGCNGCEGVGPMSVSLVQPPPGAPEEPTPPAEPTAVAKAPEETPPEAAEPAETPEPAEVKTPEAPKPPAEEPKVAAAATRKPPPPKRDPPPVRKTTPTKKPAKAAVKKIPVLIGTRPYAKVFLNGRKHPHGTPLMGDRALKLRPGRHTIEFVDDKGKRYKYRVTVHSDANEARLVIILGKSIRKAEGLSAKLVK